MQCSPKMGEFRHNIHTLWQFMPLLKEDEETGGRAAELTGLVQTWLATTRA